MLKLIDGRDELWQWDTGRVLEVDEEITQVHFSNRIYGRSIDVNVKNQKATIPDVLLQVDKPLNVWAFVGTPEDGYTKISKVFNVNKKNKPADYVFTPPEQTTLGEILERLDDIESAQDPDAIKNAVDDYLANNPIVDIPENVSAFTNDAGYQTAAEVESIVGEAIKDIPAGGQNADLYIGAAEPTGDNRPLYWLDTSDSGGVAEEYSITFNLSNATVDNTATTVMEGESYAATITPDGGYVLDIVSVTMGGKDITGTSYSNGNIYIASVTGNIVVTVSAREMTEDEKVYTITNSLVNVTTNNSAVSVPGNSTYTATLTAADGYELNSVNVTMGGANVTSDVYSDGVINIPTVTGDVVITASAVLPEVDWSEGNVIAIEHSETGSETEIGFTKTSDLTYDEFMSLSVEKVYVYAEPVDQYKKTASVRAQFTPSWGYTNVDTNAFVLNRWNKYQEKGYIVEEWDFAKVKETVQALYDDGTLDANKEKRFLVRWHIKAGGKIAILYNYNG